MFTATKSIGIPVKLKSTQHKTTATRFTKLANRTVSD